MRTPDLMFILGGLGLVIGLAYLVSPYFPELHLLWLDSVVLFISYLAFIFSAGCLFMSSQSFAKDVTSTGVFLWTSRLYIIMALLGILIGFFAKIPFKWQLYYQLFFLLITCVGVYAGACSATRLDNVAKMSEQDRTGIESLTLNIQRLRTRIEMDDQMSDGIKRGIAKLEEKAGYLSVPSSPLAFELERSLRQQLGVLLTSLEEKQPESLIEKEIIKADKILSERLKQY